MNNNQGPCKFQKRNEIESNFNAQHVDRFKKLGPAADEGKR